MSRKENNVMWSVTNTDNVQLSKPAISRLCRTKEMSVYKMLPEMEVNETSV